MYTCIYIYVKICIHTHVTAALPPRPSIQFCSTHKSSQTHTHTYTHTHIHTHTHTHTHKHTHTRGRYTFRSVEKIKDMYMKLATLLSAVKVMICMVLGVGLSKVEFRQLCFLQSRS